MAGRDLKNFGDIVAAVREELKVSSSETESIARIKRDVQTIYREVISYTRWWWLQETKTVVLPTPWKEGTARVITGSSEVTFSTPPGGNRKGQYFSTNGTNQIYVIESHVPGSSTIKLSDKYIGPTNLAQPFKIWADKIALPTNCKETIEVRDMFSRKPLEVLGRQELLRLSNAQPKREGAPKYYHTSDFVDPFPTRPIEDLPNVQERKSEGIVKHMIFDDTLPASVEVGMGLLIENSNDPTYNGEVYVAAIATTRVANDTIVYTGKTDSLEGIAPETNAIIQELDTSHARARYRELHYYPNILQSKLLLHIDFSKEVPPLENDDDEPVIPVDDRVVLLLGARHLAWARERNPEESARNLALYQAKLQRMAGYLQDSLDKAIIRPSRLYLSAKRSSMRRRNFSLPTSAFGSGGPGDSMAQEILGLPNSVAIFNSEGVLEGSADISVTELGYLDGASSNIQAQIDAINTQISGAFVTDALVSPSAAIQRSKLAAGAVNAVVVNNGSGVMVDSGILASELNSLDDNEPLVSIDLPNNTAVATQLVSIAKTFTMIAIKYSLQRGSNNVEGGDIILLNDGTLAEVTLASSNIGTLGVDLTADVSGANVRLLFTTTNTGVDARFKYRVVKWAA